MANIVYGEVSTEAQNRIINLIKEILTHYEELDSQSSNEIKYFCHNEYDSNVTEFEGLSNSNKIVLKTKINLIHIPAIMKIFQGIYDNNYYMFETSEFAEMIYDNCDREFTQNELNELMSYENIDSWLEVFDIYNHDSVDTDNDLDDGQNDSYIGNERIYDSVPVPNNNYRSNKRQKIYTIGSIKQILDE